MPRWFTQLRLRLRSVFRRGRIAANSMKNSSFTSIARSSRASRPALDPEQARFAALKALGAITQNKEACRDNRGVNWLEHLGQDLRFGVRTLLKNPAFTVVALLALALGIGVNTAMFSVAYGMLWRPLPFAHADRVAVVFLNHAARDFEYGTLCFRDYLTWKEDNRAFEEPALFTAPRMDIGGPEGVPEQVPGAKVTAGFFSTLARDSSRGTHLRARRG